MGQFDTHFKAGLNQVGNIPKFLVVKLSYVLSFIFTCYLKINQAFFFLVQIKYKKKRFIRN